MKKVTAFSTLLFALAMISMSFTTPFNGELQTYSVNVDKSNIVWKGYKVTGSHTGNIQLKNGKLDMKDGKLVGGSFDIDMTTIACSDLSGEYAQKLVGHLKSDDFFGVEKYPTAKFVITQAIPYGTPGTYKIVGNMTIKETTKQIKFQANLTEEAGATVATAAIKLDRSEYDVRFGSGSFFDNLGDKTIYDEFDLEVKLVAGK
ncbi:MAG: YceI family protein [Phaeodactylibacter sp.]|nr:YceI family protein [Phaeodactylibacter sp.]MCB9304161.1 YceI family protein [Lewinellaceae bacterium]